MEFYQRYRYGKVKAGRYFSSGNECRSYFQINAYRAGWTLFKDRFHVVSYGARVVKISCECGSGAYFLHLLGDFLRYGVKGRLSRAIVSISRY